MRSSGLCAKNFSMNIYSINQGFCHPFLEIFEQTFDFSIANLFYPCYDFFTETNIPHLEFILYIIGRSVLC